MSQAMRTCAVTRRELPRDELVRLVAAPDGTVVVDYRGKLPGRGVWIAPEAAVLEALPRQARRIGQQLGAELDAEALGVALREQVVRAVRDGLTLAARAGALVGGRERLTAALDEGRIEVVAFASDAAERTERAVREASDAPLFVTLPWTSEALGALVGRAPLAAVGVGDGRATAHLLRQLRRLSALGYPDRPDAAHR